MSHRRYASFALSRRLPRFFERASLRNATNCPKIATAGAMLVGRKHRKGTLPNAANQAKNAIQEFVFHGTPFFVGNDLTIDELMESQGTSMIEALFFDQPIRRLPRNRTLVHQK